MKTEHKYAQVLRWIADKERVEIRWGKDPRWMDLGSRNEIVFDEIMREEGDYEFRLKPRTITVNGREIVAGETVEPSFGTKYYAADPYSTVFFSDDKWSGWPEHHEWLRRGLVHLTKENAIAHAKAMLGID